MLSEPRVTMSGLALESGSNSRICPSNRMVTLPCRSSNVPPPFTAGSAGKSISCNGPVPKLFAPSCSQNRPVTASQPPSAFSAASRLRRHFSTSTRYDCPAALVTPEPTTNAAQPQFTRSSLQRLLQQPRKLLALAIHALLQLIQVLFQVAQPVGPMPASQHRDARRIRIGRLSRDGE